MQLAAAWGAGHYSASGAKGFEFPWYVPEK